MTKQSRTETITAKVSPELKEEVDKILLELGLGHSETINMFYNQIRLHKKIPFELSLPAKMPKKKTVKKTAKKTTKKK